MTAYQHRILASFGLLAVVLAFFAGSVLLQPHPAGAAGNPRQLAFPPVVVDAGERILFDCFNSSKQPTPPFTVAFLNNTGGELSSKTIDSLPPGYSDGHLYSPPRAHWCPCS